MSDSSPIVAINVLKLAKRAGICQPGGPATLAATEPVESSAVPKNPQPADRVAA